MKLRSLSALPLISVFLVLLLRQTLSAEISLVVTLIRHGDRTPASTLPSDPNQWPAGLGQLTDRGMISAFELGQNFRQRYLISLGFSESFLASDVYVRSTDYDRTLMTAQSFFTGFYPDSPIPLDAGHPVPIHTVPKDDDFLLLGAHACPKYQQVLHKTVFEGSEFQAKDRDSQTFLVSLSEALGIHVDLAAKLWKVYDVLWVDHSHSLPYPSLITEEVAQQVFTLADWLAGQYFQPGEIGRLTGSYFVHQVAADFRARIDGNNTRKFILYSAHDTTITAVLSALGIRPTSVPPYLSNLVFELRSDASQPQQAASSFVHIRYNDAPLDTPTCPKGVCSIEEFERAVEEQGFVLDSLKHECNRGIPDEHETLSAPSSEHTKQKNQLALYFGIVIAFAIALFLIGGFIAVYKWKQIKNRPPKRRYRGVQEELEEDQDNFDGL